MRPQSLFHSRDSKLLNATFFLTPAEYETLRLIAHSSSPKEVCGLIGIIPLAKGNFRIRLYHTCNGSGVKNKFEINRSDLKKALTKSAKEGASIAGCFHSHPRGLAKLSGTDRAAARKSRLRLWLVYAISVNKTGLYLTGRVCKTLKLSVSY